MITKLLLSTIIVLITFSTINVNGLNLRTKMWPLYQQWKSQSDESSLLAVSTSIRDWPEGKIMTQDLLPYCCSFTDIFQSFNDKKESKKATDNKEIQQATDKNKDGKIVINNKNCVSVMVKPCRCPDNSAQTKIKHKGCIEFKTACDEAEEKLNLLYSIRPKWMAQEKLTADKKKQQKDKLIKLQQEGCYIAELLLVGEHNKFTDETKKVADAIAKKCDQEMEITEFEEPGGTGDQFIGDIERLTYSVCHNKRDELLPCCPADANMKGVPENVKSNCITLSPIDDIAKKPTQKRPGDKKWIHCNCDWYVKSLENAVLKDKSCIATYYPKDRL